MLPVDIVWLHASVKFTSMSNRRKSNMWINISLLLLLIIRLIAKMFPLVLFGSCSTEDTIFSESSFCQTANYIFFHSSIVLLRSSEYSHFLSWNTDSCRLSIFATSNNFTQLPHILPVGFEGRRFNFKLWCTAWCSCHISGCELCVSTEMYVSHRQAQSQPVAAGYLYWKLVVVAKCRISTVQARVQQVSLSSWFGFIDTVLLIIFR